MISMVSQPHSCLCDQLQQVLSEQVDTVSYHGATLNKETIIQGGDTCVSSQGSTCRKTT